jgi:hypothetical protein
VNGTRAPGYGQVDRHYGRRLATTPPEDDGTVWMVNLMAYKPLAAYADGNPQGLTGREADDRYAPVDILAELGAEVVFVGDVEDQLLGDEPRWDRVGVVRYPTRRSFIEMQARPDFRDRHRHKEAGMATTIVMGCQPLDPSVGDGIEQRDWAEVPHPPSVDDGPVAVLHVNRYHPGGGLDQMARYQRRAAEVAARHGGRIGAWFTVEGTIVGDGRAWDEVRFNLFPSKAAFLAVVADPERVDAHRQHRAPAIADTYTLVLRPTINRLPGAG